jgi:hypothetical protein
MKEPKELVLYMLQRSRNFTTYATPSDLSLMWKETDHGNIDYLPGLIVSADVQLQKGFLVPQRLPDLSGFQAEEVARIETILSDYFSETVSN